MSRDATASGRNAPEFGETWVYESIVGALPGVSLSSAQAVGLQLGLFEVALLAIAWVYDLPDVVLPGTVAIGVAAAGSALMLRMGALARSPGVPPAYRRLLFGSSIEVVLGLLAFLALVVHLFVFDPSRGETTLLASLFGPDPPLVVVYVTLLVLWDLCYRIGTSWWTAVVALWRSVRLRFDAPLARRLRRLDVLNVGFGLVQAALLPFVADRPVLFVVVAGHVVAVTVVSAVAFALVRVE